jgi:hypothetical protein
MNIPENFNGYVFKEKASNLVYYFYYSYGRLAEIILLHIDVKTNKIQQTTIFDVLFMSESDVVEPVATAFIAIPINKDESVPSNALDVVMSISFLVNQEIGNKTLSSYVTDHFIRGLGRHNLIEG